MSVPKTTKEERGWLRCLAEEAWEGRAQETLRRALDDADTAIEERDALAAEVAKLKAQKTEAGPNPLTPTQRLGVMMILLRIASWTNARFDQHLRHNIGDENADAVLRVLAALGVLPPECDPSGRIRASVPVVVKVENPSDKPVVFQQAFTTYDIDSKRERPALSPYEHVERPIRKECLVAAEVTAKIIAQCEASLAASEAAGHYQMQAVEAQNGLRCVLALLRGAS